jgi:PEP-CTERM motif
VFPAQRVERTASGGAGDPRSGMLLEYWEEEVSHQRSDSVVFGKEMSGMSCFGTGGKIKTIDTRHVPINLLSTISRVSQFNNNREFFMRTSIKLLVSLIALSAGAAEATTYIGNRTIGTGSASLSITTDGTIGVLSTANITGWTIGLNEPGFSFTLQGPTSGSNSQVLVSGSALTATSTDILFDFSAGSGFALFQNPNIGSGQHFYCTQINACFDFAGPGEGVEASTDFSFTRNSLSGNVVLASVSGPAVPEPASWALLIVGFAAVGASMRARKVAVRFA